MHECRKVRGRRPAVLCLAWALVFFAGTQALHAQSPSEAGPSTLSAARAALAKRLGGPDFAIHLETYALGLKAQDSLALFDEFIPKADKQRQPALYRTAGDLAYAGSLFSASARFYAKALPAFPELGLKIALCHIMAGEGQKALVLLDSLPDQSGAAGIAGEKNLLKAWLAYEAMDIRRAVDLLAPLARKEGQGALARQALYMLWAIGVSLGEGEAAGTLVPKDLSPSAVKAILSSRFPGSLEAALVQGRAVQRPSPLILAGFGQELEPSRAAQDAQGSMAVPLASAVQDEPPAFSRLQVGLFSRKENAVALSAKLLEHGFSAVAEERVSPEEPGPRWAVVVVTAKDWAATVAKLKDLGYETYLLP